MGRLVSELLIKEGMNVTVTLREYHKGSIIVPKHARTIGYSERYRALEMADIVVSATKSPHYTLCAGELEELSGLPDIIVDLAVPRDVEPAVQAIPGLTLLTIDDISEDSRVIPPGSLAMIDRIIEDHIEKYYRWASYKEKPVRIIAVGLGPGDADYLAPAARKALLACDVIAGYTPYLELIPELLAGKEIISTGMKSEVERCESAIKEALSGKKVCVVSSGDAGIYGMASLLFERADDYPGVEVEVIPGITAAASAAAILGSPLTNDFAVVSLSDLLTPWDVIEKKVGACAAADFVLCLYNPQSLKRKDYLEKACDILLRYKPPETICGYVRNAFRGNSTESRICSLLELSRSEVDMFTTVVIGNASTKNIGGKMITVRGYKR
jgi:precorrin-3B C17-methyltransferase